MGKLFDKYASCRATDAEKAPSYMSFIGRDFHRDTRRRIYVCDCFTLAKEAGGKNIWQLHAGMEVTPLADGTCPHCGYYARLELAVEYRKGSVPKQKKKGV